MVARFTTRQSAVHRSWSFAFRTTVFSQRNITQGPASIWSNLTAVYVPLFDLSEACIVARPHPYKSALLPYCSFNSQPQDDTKPGLSAHVEDIADVAALCAPRWQLQELSPFRRHSSEACIWAVDQPRQTRHTLPAPAGGAASDGFRTMSPPRSRSSCSSSSCSCWDSRSRSDTPSRRLFGVCTFVLNSMFQLFHIQQMREGLHSDGERTVKKRHTRGLMATAAQLSLSKVLKSVGVCAEPLLERNARTAAQQQSTTSLPHTTTTRCNEE